MILIPTINNRQDLDAINGTIAYETFMTFLKGSMTHKQDTAVYPDGYGQPGYSGLTVDPIWADIEDLSTIKQYGFKKLDFA